MIERVLRFGSGAQLYTFPTNTVQEFSDNFRSVVVQTSRLPGMSGGFNEYGMEQPPGKIGLVKVRFFLVSHDPTGMTALRDDVALMRTFGLKRLVMQPSDPNLPQRWCYAVAEDITAPKNLEDAGVFQEVTVNFHVPDPVWYAPGTEGPLWGSFTWGDGTIWGGSAPVWAASGEQTDQTITREGTAIVQPRIRISCGTGETCQNPTIQRLVGGMVVDEVSYTGTLEADDVLEINARANSVKLNGNHAYTSAFDFDHPSWFRLYPGENNIRILFENSSDEANVQMFYYEGYY